MPDVLKPPMSERARLMLGLLRGVDLASVDGRGGLNAFLAEVERLAPGCIRRAAAVQDRLALGVRS